MKLSQGEISSIKSLIITFFSVLFAVCMQAQSVTSVLPYDMKAGKMIVTMQVDGRPFDFVFDTGAERSLVTKEFCEATGQVVSDSTLIIDSNSQRSYYYLTELKDFTTPDKAMNFVGFKAAVMPNSSPFMCLDVFGIIGCDLLSQSICEIDHTQKRIILTHAGWVKPEYLRYSFPFAVDKALPLFDIQMNGMDVRILLDTGSNSFLTLKKNDLVELIKKGAVTEYERGIGGMTIGVGGMSGFNQVERTTLRSMRMGPAKFKEVRTTTGNVPYTLVGSELLNYGKLIFDFPGRRFYFIPATAESVVPFVKKATFGISARPDGKLVVATVWEGVKGLVEIGELVELIDGKPAPTKDICDVVLRGITELSQKGTLTLTLKSLKGEEKVVDFVIE